MALGDNYATLTQLKSRLGIADTDDDTELSQALTASSRGIELCCHRQFNDAGSATARIYRADSIGLVRVDDFSTTVGVVLATDNNADGVFETTWTTAQYELRPLNGVVEGQPGWPYSRIAAMPFSPYFPRNWRAGVQLTARWGWAAVPMPIELGTLILAEDLFKLKDMPFGAGGYGEWGRIKARENPNVMLQIGPYIRNPVLIS